MNNENKGQVLSKKRLHSEEVRSDELFKRRKSSVTGHDHFRVPLANVTTNVQSSQGNGHQPQASGSTKPSAPLVKTSLRRKNERGLKLNDSLYDDEYHESNFSYMLIMEQTFLIKQQYVRQRVDLNYRVHLINFLFVIQQSMGYFDSTIFTAVYLFNKVIVERHIDRKGYSFIAIVSLWIATKYQDTKEMKLSTVSELLKHKYDNRRILEEERKILKMVQFQLNFPDPCAALYYINYRVIQYDAVIYYGAMMFLDSFMLLAEFFSVPSTTLAAVATYLGLQKYKKDNSRLLRFVNDNLLQSTNFIKLCEVLLQKAECCFEHKVATDAIKQKYTKSSKLQVAKVFGYM